MKRTLIFYPGFLSVAWTQLLPTAEQISVGLIGDSRATFIIQLCFFYSDFGTDIFLLLLNPCSLSFVCSVKVIFNDQKIRVEAAVMPSLAGLCGCWRYQSVSRASCFVFLLLFTMLFFSFGNFLVSLSSRSRSRFPFHLKLAKDHKNLLSAFSQESTCGREVMDLKPPASY